MTMLLDRCFLLPRQQAVFACLGRAGDLIILLPAFMEYKRRTGVNPIVYVSKDYANVLDGVSYVDREVVNDDWYNGMPAARRMAEEKYGGAIVLPWWHDPESAKDILMDIHDHGARVLQSHGKMWGVNCADNPDFGTSMWRRAGFTREEMISLPLVFDRRNPAREQVLFNLHIHDKTKPLLLYNFAGISSPFGYSSDVFRVMQPFRPHFNMLDLGPIRAARIYDLLAFYDKAVGLITIDTATAHLAPASKVPTLWLTVPNWGKSIPRGNVALHIQYDEVPKRLQEIHALLEKWKTAS